jgi:hypothetical protein
MSEKSWIKICETPESHKALLVQSILKEHGIESVLLNKMDSTNIMMGEISVMVSQEQAAEALLLIDPELL